MANNLLTISQITNDALDVLTNQLTFADGVVREYDDQFARTGAKIGNTLNIRKPGRFIGTSGPNLAVEDFNETYVPLVLGSTANYGDQFHVDTSFTTQDLLLSLGDFSERIVKPAIAAIANRIDYVGLQMAKNSVANIVGIPGTAPTSFLTYLNAQAILDSEAAPRDGNRRIVMEPFTNAAIVDSLKGLLTPENTVGDQYKKGMMGRDAAGLSWFLDQNVALQNFGYWAGASASTLTYNTSTMAGALSSGWASNSTITLTNGAALTLNQGDTFTIAGVYGVNPQNRQSYGRLRNFVVNSTVSASGSGTISVNVSPAIITAGQFQNCVVTSTSSTATVTPLSIGVSGAGTVSPQNIMFHKNAFAFATADLPMVGGVDMCSRSSDKDAGVSIRLVRQYTINNDSLPARFDVLFGWAPLYPELAVRVAA